MNLRYDSYMKQFSTFVQSPIVNITLGVFLSILWIFFASIHVEAYRSTGKIGFLVFCASETLQAFFFLIRRTPKEVAIDPFAWMVAIAGSFVPFLLRPSEFTLWPGGEYILIFGVILQIVGLLSLNRSFGIVAAKRKIMKQGMYAIIRHPMYSSYIFLFLGYLLFNTSWMNAFIVLASFIFLFLRISEEEKLLSKDEEYQAYKKEVKWRLIPFVY